MNKHLGTLTPEGKKTEPINKHCLICMRSLEETKNTTHSFLCENGEPVTYFFRTQKACWQSLSDLEKRAYESSLVDSI